MYSFQLLATLLAVLAVLRYAHRLRQTGLPGYIGDKVDVMTELRKTAMRRLGAWDVFDALSRKWGEMLGSSNTYMLIKRWNVQPARSRINVLVLYGQNPCAR